MDKNSISIAISRLERAKNIIYYHEDKVQVRIMSAYNDQLCMLTFFFEMVDQDKKYLDNKPEIADNLSIIRELRERSKLFEGTGTGSYNSIKTKWMTLDDLYCYKVLNAIDILIEELNKELNQV